MNAHACFNLGVGGLIFSDVYRKGGYSPQAARTYTTSHVLRIKVLGIQDVQIDNLTIRILNFHIPTKFVGRSEKHPTLVLASVAL